MTPAQMETFRAAMNIRPGHEWDRVRRPRPAGRRHCRRSSIGVPFASGGERRLQAPRIAVPAELAVPIQPKMSTQTGFGALLNEIARGDDAARRRASSPPRPT